MFLASILLILLSSIFFASILNHKSRISYILSIYIFGYGSIALIGNIGHFFSLLGSSTYLLVSQLILFLLIYFFWIKFNRPKLFQPFHNVKNWTKKFPEFVKSYPDIFLLIVFVSLGYLILAYTWYLVPPNNNDSISTHLPRVIYWIQHGNFSPWDTARIFQLMYPVNSGLQFWWSILLTQSDKFVGIVQWSAALVAAFCIYGISGLLGSKFPGKIFASLIFLTIPSVVMQSTTTQNDLTAAALFGISFYFLILFTKDKSKSNLVLSALTLGLVVGTKQTILYLIPGYGLVISLMWLYFKKIKTKEIFIFSAVALISFLIIGSTIFFINYDYFGHPLGGKDVVASSIQATSSIQTSLSQISINSMRFLYQMVDPTGLFSPFWRWGIKLRTVVGENLFHFLKIPIEADIHNTYPHKFSLSKVYLFQEDETWFGFIGFLVLIPTFIYQSIIGFLKKDATRICIFIFGFTFLIFLSLLRPGWDPYQGRYFLPIVVICFGYASKWVNNSLPIRVLTPFFIIFGLMVLTNGILYNPAKPILDYPVSIIYRYPEDPGFDQIHDNRKISNLNYFQRMSIQTYSNYSLCEFVNQHIPENARLGYLMSESYYQEYCFFGKEFSRKLIPIYPQERINNEPYLVEKDVEYLLIYRADKFEELRLKNFLLYKESPDGEIQIYKRIEQKM